MIQRTSNPRKTDSRRVEQAWEAFEMRVKGLSLRDIARELGVSYQTVSNRIEFANKLIILPGVVERRAMENERLDRLWEKLQPKVERADTRAIEVAIKLLERRAKLNGLDAPTQHDVKVHEVTQRDLELAELTREAMMRRHGQLDGTPTA
jgi:transcriptional regulator with XRE-family HTH domain